MVLDFTDEIVHNYPSSVYVFIGGSASWQSVYRDPFRVKYAADVGKYISKQSVANAALEGNEPNSRKSQPQIP